MRQYLGYIDLARFTSKDFVDDVQPSSGTNEEHWPVQPPLAPPTRPSNRDQHHN